MCHTIFYDLTHLNSSLKVACNYFESHHDEGAVYDLGGAVKKCIILVQRVANMLIENIEVEIARKMLKTAVLMKYWFR